MGVYWLLFILPVIALLSPYKLKVREQNVIWLCYALTFVVLIGLRQEVGADWFTYESHFHHVGGLTFLEALTYSDPGYYGISWLVSQVGGSIHVLNAVCAAIVMWGVIGFARAQPLPWLAFVAAVPYLIIVVAMGYTRQGVALGLALIGLRALGQQNVLRFVVWVFIAALFHKSAVLLLPIAALAASRRRAWTFAWVGVTSVVGAALLLLDDSDQLWTRHVNSDYQSQGGLVRVLMNALPALLFLGLRRRLGVTEAEGRLWFWLSIFALVCVPLVLVSSTATDRVALYFIPIQLYVISHLQRIGNTVASRTAIVLGSVIYLGAVLFVWLNYSSHAEYWLPYRFMPL